MLDINQDWLDQTANDLRELGGDNAVLPIIADVTDPESVESAVARTIEEMGGLHILAHLAATPDSGTSTPAPGFDVIDVNLSGPFLMSHAVSGHMLEQGYGRIIGVTTSMDTMWRKGGAPYGPSKAGHEALISIMAQDLEGTGVTANVLTPGGATATNMVLPPEGAGPEIADPAGGGPMTTGPDLDAATLTAAELLGRAAELVPRTQGARGPHRGIAASARRNVSDLLSSGLYRIGVPKRFGGIDGDYGLIFDVAAELGRGCASTAWCYCLWAAHAWLVGYWRCGAREVFGASPDALCSSSLGPGKSTCLPTVEGGYRLSGRWEFSSGCDSASWLILGVSGIGERNWVLVPRSDFEIIDNWFVSGLRGSGARMSWLETLCALPPCPGRDLCGRR
ncbi:Flavin-dependent monooxygenase, oxygenase subunit HsaA [Geodia barretti]|uniref:Flavin-dependent monooxygenase, oxygenase subunit HsaA n=1 Tax=Geodia barretti TaxID=519541 RepID=A0AA35RBN4_GEOBA|nr:Flavin-dependent monooxygenase, oxygenase subunit HsaA [Geodia barretti]